MSDDSNDATKPKPAHGLFGPGIFGTGIDLSALDEDTAYRLGIFMGEQVRDSERRGYERGRAEALDGWPSLPENVRMLITDAHSLLTQAADNDALLDQHTVSVWRQHCEAIFAGRFGRYALEADGSGVDTGDGAS